jgi:hypothetical protein
LKIGDEDTAALTMRGDYGLDTYPFSGDEAIGNSWGKEMTEITALDGSIIHIDCNSVTIVAGPFPGDPPKRSYVTGPGPAPITTNEDAATLVARINPKVLLAKLTRPNNTPVWIQGSAVTLVRPPIDGDAPPEEKVGAVLFIGDNHQAVVQDVATACSIVNSHGGNL